MKLLFCLKCQDVVRFQTDVRRCACGNSWGAYLDDELAEYGGTCVAIGFANASLALAVRHFKRDPQASHPFEAFVIPLTSETCRKRAKPRKA